MYKALVVAVQTRPHPNADRLKIALCEGASVVVGIDTQDGDIGLFFPAGGQLSEVFAAANNLMRIKHEDGTVSGGMFDENLRVRAMRLRGVKSEGFWCPLSYLQKVPGIRQETIDSLSVGMSFDTLDGVELCRKYYTQQEKKILAERATQKKEPVTYVFPEHVDTEQYRFVKQDIPSGAIIHISEKLHGTSGRYGHVKVQRKHTWFEKVAMWFGIKVDTTSYQDIIGTRRTVLKHDGSSFYGDETFRTNAIKGVALKDDEIIYAELVGYTTTGTLIMAAQDTKELGKEFTKKYGSTMKYTYGCEEGTCKVYVYRITQHGNDLSHFQMIQRCHELGLQPVPTLTTIVYDGTLDTLDGIVESLMYGESTLDPRHIREGVVLRIEHTYDTMFVKAKSVDFGILEGYIKSSGLIDREDVS